jgi:hypothetical protein
MREVAVIINHKHHIIHNDVTEPHARLHEHATVCTSTAPCTGNDTAPNEPHLAPEQLQRNTVTMAMLDELLDPRDASVVEPLIT